MSEKRQAELLAQWLDAPAGTLPPPELDREAVEAVIALQPERAPAPRLDLQALAEEAGLQGRAHSLRLIRSEEDSSSSKRVTLPGGDPSASAEGSEPEGSGELVSLALWRRLRHPGWGAGLAAAAVLLISLQGDPPPAPSLTGSEPEAELLEEPAPAARADQADEAPPEPPAKSAVRRSVTSETESLKQAPREEGSEEASPRPELVRELAPPEPPAPLPELARPAPEPEASSLAGLSELEDAEASGGSALGVTAGAERSAVSSSRAAAPKRARSSSRRARAKKEDAVPLEEVASDELDYAADLAPAPAPAPAAEVEEEPLREDALLLGQEALRIGDWTAARARCAELLRAGEGEVSRRDDARLCGAEAALRLALWEESRGLLEDLEAPDARQQQEAESLRQQLETAESAP